METPEGMDARERAEEARVAGVLRDLAAMRACPCRDCGRPLCPHEALLCLAIGFDQAPRCLPCLARALGQPVGAFRDHLAAFVRRRPCLSAGWRWASEAEGVSESAPVCLWPDGGPSPAAVPGPAVAAAGEPPPQAADAAWDAGPKRCGELAIELRLRLAALQPGQVLRVIARDPAAPEDLPAWCRLTGHSLLAAVHPLYWIKKKES